MSSFGENLRREREMRGVTLEEMSETTKISLRLLGALERDRFDELPGGVFTRSFIRAYAKYLGLDEEHVLSEFKRVAKPSTDNDISRLTPPRILTDGRPRGRVLPWVVIAVLLGSGYAVYRYSRRSLDTAAASGRTAPAPATPASSEPVSQASTTSGSAQNAAQPAESGSAPRGSQTPGGSNPASPAGSETGPRAGSAQGSAKTGNPAADNGVSGPLPVSKSAEEANPSVPVLGDGDMVLQVKTSEEAWVAVAADGKTLMQHLLPPNSTRIFRAKEGFDVTTGNAQGTVLTFNGTDQKALGREGEFKRIHLARSTPPEPDH